MSRDLVKLGGAFNNKPSVASYEKLSLFIY